MNFSSKKLTIQAFILLMLIVITPSKKIFAGDEHFTNKVELSRLANGDKYKVADDKYPIMLLNPTTWQNNFAINGVSKASVILKVDPNHKDAYTAFTANATVNITYTNKALVTNTINGVQLSLSYDPTAGTVSTNQSIYAFTDAHLVTVELVSASSSLGSIPKNLILESKIDVERYYPFDQNFVPSIDHEVAIVEGGADRMLRFEWPVIVGAEAYDLEWTFVDDYNGIGLNKNFDFTNNATRVILANNHYEIPLVYEKGYILYRVRGVGKLAPNYTQRTPGAWSSKAFTYTKVSDYPDKYNVAEHESDKFNWGYQSFFTENGARGEGVSYFDGLLNNRQNASMLNTEEHVVVQESFYDYQGRPAVSALPTPIKEKVFKYRENFNKANATGLAYGPADFDVDAPSPKMQETTSGAAYYYSGNNTEQDGSNAYIPYAEGYPYTQTLYTSDLTGRVKKQGGLGPDHKIGSGHESKYYYGKPLQHKLTKLFGTDAGYSQAYSETMVIDPNGQASVSIADASGRVVATNLAGDPPTNLEGLPSHAAAEQITVDILNNTIDPADNYGSLISTQSYISKAGGQHDFAYTFTPETYDNCLPTNLCFDCVYDLTISIYNTTDGCATMIPGGSYTQTIGNLPIDLSCTNAPFTITAPGVLSVTLPVGSYMITKELHINKDAIDGYAEQYMENSTCLLTYQDFLDSELSAVDFSTCNQDYCTLKCKNILGSEQEWLVSNPGGDYQAALQSCISTCNTPSSPCEYYKEAMMLDMSKGGQYGLFYDVANQTVDVSLFPLSVFNVNNSLPQANANWTNPNGTYVDADETTTSLIEITLVNGVYQPAINTTLPTLPPSYVQVNGKEYIQPQDLANVSDFLSYWKPSWGLALMEYHPEYCGIGFICATDEQLACRQHIAPSNLYDEAMMTEPTYSGAASAGFLNPLNSTPVPTGIAANTTNIDPFLNYLGCRKTTFPSEPDYHSQFSNALTSYYTEGGTTVSMWEFAYASVHCPTAATGAAIKSCSNGVTFGTDACMDDLVWRAFRELYQGKKREFLDLFITNYMIENDCYNGCVDKTNFIANHAGDFSFNAYPPPSGTYNGTADADQPCNSTTAALYQDKVKIISTIYDDYAPASWPPTTVLADATAQSQTFCEDICEYSATSWIAQLSGCGLSPTTEAALKADLKLLCKYECDPYNTTAPSAGTTVEAIMITHLGSGYETATCNSLVINQPEPYVASQNTGELLDDCGCDKLLQNEWDYTDASTNNILPTGVNNSADLFFHTYGYVPETYNMMVCKCDAAFQLDAPGNPWTPTNSPWGALGKAELANLAIPVSEELACEDCKTCADILTAKSNFNAQYSFYQSHASYYGYLATYLNRLYGEDYSAIELEEFIDNCNTLNGPGTPVWYQTQQGKDLEKLLNKLVGGGDLFYDQATALDLLGYVGSNSLRQNFAPTGFNYWSSISPSSSTKCAASTITLTIGDATSNCTVDLDLTPALNAGYNFGFCDIISLSNLRHRGTACTNLDDFYIDARFFDGTAIYTATIHGTSSCGGGAGYAITTCTDSYGALTMCTAPELDDEVDDCVALLSAAAISNAEQAYITYYNTEYNKILSDLKSKCLSAEPTESFNMTYWDQENHYTLYYYDQAGNLVQTVPPSGVQPFTIASGNIATANTYRDNNTGQTLVPTHALETKYRYNSYSQLVEQKTPDAGIGKFWYDVAGRLVVSQNAEQITTGAFSYTIYDEYGRIVEVGENTTTSAMTKTIAEDPAQLTAWYSSGTKTEITRTFYDNTVDAAIDAYFANGQENLRLRVATVAYYETNVANTAYDNAIHYSYDIAGNVKHAVMENKDLLDLSNSIKHLSYDYDLVSGNVNQVIYQEGATDQYFHKYEYDADNRIHDVYTSKDGLIWEKDAKYFYYPHGPLARIELGDEKVQGIDLAYTIQGWLKGVNSNTLKEDRDLGKDAIEGYLANASNTHKSVAKDAFGYSLNYFTDDYTAISGNSFEATITGTPYDVANSNLYNGNIRGMVTAIEGMDILGNAYKYDQLNRLRTSTVYSGVNTTTNTWAGSSALVNYLTDIKYDGNGNIYDLNRNGNDATPDKMDDMDYYYYADNGLTYKFDLTDKRYEDLGGNALPAGVEMTNKLAYVVDHDGLTNQNDYLGGSAAQLFEYDNIGNLITDPVEEIDPAVGKGIEWTVYGKVKKITRKGNSSKPDLEFKYDAMGNRIMKLVKPRNGSGLENEDKWTYNYYQYDAGGNLLAIYEKTFSDLGGGSYQAFLKVKEMNLYGSNRVGVDARNKLLVDQTFTANITNNQFDEVTVTNTNIATDHPNLWDHTLGNKTFELANHLGNVLATVSDKKLPVTGNLPNTAFISYFDGTDFSEFATDDYSSMQSSTYYYLGADQYSVKTEYPAKEFGPKIEFDVDEGDVISASVFTYITSGTSGKFVMGLQDKFTGAWVQVNGSGTDEMYTKQSTTTSTWKQLTHSYTVPTNLNSSNVKLVVQLWNPDGTNITYWDNLSINITHNTPKILSYTADITSRQMYYPFGMVMPNGNNLNASGHTYGFNGKENVDEVSGSGNVLDYGFRIYNPRISKFLSVDPLTSSYPMLTPYQFANNTPIQAIDIDGLEAFYVHGTWSNPKTFSALEKENFETIRFATGNTTHLTARWRGGPNSDKGRKRAAKQLAQNIAANRDYTQPLTIVGHSHGGNVAIMAANILKEQGMEVDFLITINTPVREYQLEKGTKTLHYNIYHEKDPVQASGGDEYTLPKISFKEGKINLDYESAKMGYDRMTGEVGPAGREFDDARNLGLENPVKWYNPMTWNDYHNSHNTPEQWGLWLTKAILFDTALKGVGTGSGGVNASKLGNNGNPGSGVNLGGKTKNLKKIRVK